MKAPCIILTIIVVVAIMAVCVMVKFATEIAVEERSRSPLIGGAIYKVSKSMGVISLRNNSTSVMSKRFPYVAAVIKNASSTWSFACFASVILAKWIVTSAHCRRPGTTHRVLIYQEFAKNFTHTYSILFWRIHEKFNMSDPSPKFDIAVAKLNVNIHPFSVKPALIDEKPANAAESSVWKTVSTMDKKIILTDDFEKFEFKIAPQGKCYENYGIEVDEDFICVDMSAYEDCFVHEFGPIFDGDKVVGVLTMFKPRDCDMKFAIFTNVSYYTGWILKSTRTTYA